MKFSQTLARLAFSFAAIGLSCLHFAVACTSDPAAPHHMTQLGGRNGMGGLAGGSGVSTDPTGGAGGEPPLEPEAGVCAGYQCGVNQVCVAVEDFATCQCGSGFSGTDCIDINECSTPHRCGAGGKCVNFQGTFSCECAEGTARDGAGCTEFNECKGEASACDSQASCTDSAASHICTCDPGLSGDGTFCKQEDSCADSPCGEGTCRNTLTGFACECPLGRSGPRCENTCSLDEAIQFGSAIIEQAVRNVVSVSGDITPRMLGGVSELYVTPPDSNLATDDEVTTLDGLECWPTLRKLDLRGHGVSDVGAAASLGSLETLNLTCNRASDLSPLARLSRLQDLSFGKGPLCSDSERHPTDFAFLKELTSLRRLDASFYGLGTDALAFSRLKRLKFLDLRGNNLANISGLAELTQLEELNLAQNPLSSIGSLSTLALLKRLNLAMSGISNLGPLADLQRLEEIDLSSNGLDQVTGLEKNQALRIVRLSDNAISDLEPLGALPHVLVIDVAENQVKSLGPLVSNLSFTSGQLWLSSNPFDCTSGASALNALQKRGVTVFGACGH